MCEEEDDIPYKPPRHRYIKSYSHLARNVKSSICKRYGHRFKLATKIKTCERCGSKVKLSIEDLLNIYFERKALKALKAGVFGLPVIFKANPPKTEGATLTFNKWEPKN